MSAEKIVLIIKILILAAALIGIILVPSLRLLIAIAALVCGIYSKIKHVPIIRLKKK